MADSYVQLPIDGAGKKLDAEQLTVGANTVQRERLQIAGAAATEVAAVKDTDVGDNLFGLVTREAGPVFPVRESLIQANLGIGSSVNLDASVIPAGKTGKLWQVTLSSSVACKWTISTRDGASIVTIDVVFTSGLTGQPVCKWKPPHRDFAKLLGDGVDTNFRITAVNLDGRNAADVYATPYWDEV